MPVTSGKQRKLFGVDLSMEKNKAKKTNTPSGRIASKMISKKIKDFTRKMVKSIDEFIIKQKEVNLKK